MPRDEHYLGDGLYASFDGFQVLLRAPREHGDHWVGLEWNVFCNLVQWAQGPVVFQQKVPETRTYSSDIVDQKID
jgi:hypothetical protein